MASWLQNRRAQAQAQAQAEAEAKAKAEAEAKAKAEAEAEAKAKAEAEAEALALAQAQAQAQEQAQSQPEVNDDEQIAAEEKEVESLKQLNPTDCNVTEDRNRDPFMGVKVRRKDSFHINYIGDYLDVPSQPYLVKILEKQGDKKVLFADKVLKFTSTGKMKRRILLITDFAVYIVDPDIDALKRRIALAAVERLCLSELSDNFFAIIIPTEYDLLMASTRKTEIVTVLVDAMRSQSDYELEVQVSNRFEYNATSELVKEIEFEEVEGGVKTRIMRK